MTAPYVRIPWDRIHAEDWEADYGYSAPNSSTLARFPNWSVTSVKDWFRRRPKAMSTVYATRDIRTARSRPMLRRTRWDLLVAQ